MGIIVKLAEKIGVIGAFKIEKKYFSTILTVIQLSVKQSDKVFFSLNSTSKNTFY